MTRPAYLSVAVGLVLLGAILIRSLPNSVAGRTPLSRVLQGTGTPQNEVKARVATEPNARLPLYFEVNQGQTDRRVRFLARGIGQTLFLTDREAVLLLTKRDPLPMELALRTTFVGANPESRLAGLDELPGKANYFIGRDPTQWHTNVPLYAKVRYHDLYPGIDLSYSGDQRHWQYHFVLGADADPQRIVLGWRGVDSLQVNAQGDLVLHTAWGAVLMERPVVCQQLDGTWRDIAGRYVIKGADRVGIQVMGNEASHRLVIVGTMPFNVLNIAAGTTTFASPSGPTHLSITPLR
jgi:hypothetical protein